MNESLHPTLQERLNQAAWLPTPHGPADRMLDLIERDEAEGGSFEAEEVARVLLLDAAFVANVLALGARPDSEGDEAPGELDLAGAVQRLDRRALRLAATSFSAAEVGAAEAACERARETALGVALARELATRSEQDPDMAACAVLFSGVGEQALAAWLPEEYATLVECTERRLDRLPHERELFGVDHASLAAAWLAAHGVTGRMVDAVEQQYDVQTKAAGIDTSDGGDSPAAALAELVGVARELAEMLHRSRSEDVEPSVPARLFVQLEQRYALGASAWAELATQAQAAVAEQDALWSLQLDEGARAGLIERAHDVAARAALAWGRSQMRPQRQELARATQDAESGVANRAYFDDRLELLLRTYKRDQIDAALWLVELDGYPELAARSSGEKIAPILRRVGRALTSAVREVDLVARFDESTFVILGPRTDWRGACILANRLRPIIARLALAGGDERSGLTASIGVAILSGVEGVPTVARLMASAQAQLDCARRAGGNTWAFRDKTLAEFKAA